jgi:hypothetical protein
VSNAGQADANGNGLGDACECASPVALENAKVKLGKRTTPPGDDTLVVKAQLTVPTSPTIDPHANGVRIRVQDDAGGTVLDASLPGGAYDATLRTGWKVNGSGTSWRLPQLRRALPGSTSSPSRPAPKTPGLVKLVAKTRRRVPTPSDRSRSRCGGGRPGRPVRLARLCAGDCVPERIRSTVHCS